MRLCAFLLLLSGSAFGQLFSVGVRGGVPISDFFDIAQGTGVYNYVSNTDRYIIGPTAAVHLPFGFSVQVDALYRSLGYRLNISNPASTVDASASSWQFPILAQWAFLPGPIKPFVDFGPTFQKITGFKRTVNVVTNPSELNNDSTVGFTFGGGVQLKLGRLRIEPEFRYTRWGSEAFTDPVNALLTTNRNQGDFLVGITF
jgi:opacity protein-like surface antigen